VLKKLIRDLVQKSPSLLAFEHLFRARIGAYKIDLQSIHNLFVDNSKKSKTSSLDLGSGPNPQNRFGADEVFGLDLIEDKDKKIFRCKLGFERIPFDDNSFDYITAYDLIEHIPRYSDSENSNTPFIQLMNECYRVLKKDGIFLSMTPVYPYLGAFQDPTHNNIITVDTFKHYFSEDKFKIAFHYGVTANFRILDQKMYGQHLIAVLTK